MASIVEGVAGPGPVIAARAIGVGWPLYLSADARKKLSAREVCGRLIDPRVIRRSWRGVRALTPDSCSEPTVREARPAKCGLQSLRARQLHAILQKGAQGGHFCHNRYYPL
jgi:hypothetical protein